jgi:hypothetical protein
MITYRSVQIVCVTVRRSVPGSKSRKRALFFSCACSRLSLRQRGTREKGSRKNMALRLSRRAENGRANYLNSTHICISTLPGGLPIIASVQQLLCFVARTPACSICSEAMRGHPSPSMECHIPAPTNHPFLAAWARSYFLFHTKLIPRGALEEAAISVSEMIRRKKSDRRIYSRLCLRKCRTACPHKLRCK